MYTLRYSLKIITFLIFTKSTFSHFLSRICDSNIEQHNLEQVHYSAPDLIRFMRSQWRGRGDNAAPMVESGCCYGNRHRRRHVPIFRQPAVARRAAARRRNVRCEGGGPAAAVLNETRRRAEVDAATSDNRPTSMENFHNNLINYITVIVT